MTRVALMKRLHFVLIMGISPMVFGGVAEDLLKESGVTGGLVVHVGCGEGQVTSELRINDAFLVHGMDPQISNIRKAQKHIIEKGLHGRVTVEHWTEATLPFNDNLVNLIVVEDAGRIPASEIQRVVCPNGVIMTQVDGQWEKSVKPRPADIDEWTHFLRDASNNAVAKDKKIAPPRHLQWKSGPAFSRDHDSLASISALTSSNGRIFYILDEGPTSMIHRPSKWRLIARDAFNGKLLWKRDIPTWVTQLANFRAGPAQMSRRLVSVGDRVFVTLALDGPVEMLDAVTGKTLHTFAGSEKTEELIVHDGMLLVALGDPAVLTDAVSKVDGYWQMSARDVKPIQKQIIAYNAGTGKALWRKNNEKTAHYIQLSMIADKDQVYYLDGDGLQCLDFKSGRERWHAEFPLKGTFLLNYAPTVVSSDDVVLCLSHKRLCAFSHKDGRKLWEQKGAIGLASPGDLFVINGLVWTIPMTKELTGSMGESVSIEDFLGNGGKEFWAMDLHTGEVKKQIPRGILPGVHHHRCYRNKATEDYLVYGQGGTEFLDVHGENHSGNLWTRGICQYGIMPANGYLYIPPHPCQCYSQDMLHGFYALSASNSTEGMTLEPELQKGPSLTEPWKGRGGVTAPAKAPGMIWHPPIRGRQVDEWPMYRGDITRSGSSLSHVGDNLAQAWDVTLGGDLTAATVADKRLYVCSKADQIVYCLDAVTGRILWQYPVLSKVDSPPTIVGGLCVFGCTDGSVYCLKAQDGTLRWQFRVSKTERRTVVDDHIESVWPIHGSVLVLKDTVYFAAGRSSHLDGGIRLFAVDLVSGALKKQVTLSSDGAKGSKAAVNMDVLVTDGALINMGVAQFDLELNVSPLSQLSTLISDTGFLGDNWFHRENWVLGGVKAKLTSTARTTMGTQPGRNDSIFGKLIVFNQSMAYGVKNPYTWHKYASRIPTHTGHYHQKYSRYDPDWFPVGTRIFSFDNGVAYGKGKESWGVDMKFQPRAIALAGDNLFLAGWHDAMAIHPKSGLPLDPKNPDPRDCVLRTVSIKDGKVLNEYKIPGEPAYDGMAIAYGRIYLPLKNGAVLCFEGR